MNIKEAIAKLLNKENLTEAEMGDVMNQIMDFEDQYVLKTKPIKNPEAMNCDPMPDVRWRVWSMDLVMLTQLIDEKTRDESGCGFFPS